MRQSHRLGLLVLLVILTGLACRLVTGLPPDTTSTPDNQPEDRSLKFSPENLPEAQQGLAYEARIDIGNVKTFVGEFKVSEGELPTGLALERIPSENATKITGTPQAAGTFSFKLEVQCMGTNDPGQVGEKGYTIVVKAAP